MKIEKLKKASIRAVEQINKFSEETLKIRGGRIGSGMGLLIEALWGYYLNKELKNEDFEIGWVPEHKYNDFVCLRKGEKWDISTKEGEVYRIELKSMSYDAKESKAHFEVLSSEIGINDLIVVIVWQWKEIEEYQMIPQIRDQFIGLAKEIIKLRDELHKARGGSFVTKEKCPEQQSCNCERDCRYLGEPLNSEGTRERATGPGKGKSASKNFGGMVRMTKTRGTAAKKTLSRLKEENSTIAEYLSFLERNSLKE